MTKMRHIQYFLCLYEEIYIFNLIYFFMALKKSAVIIGAGIGGIATSVYLSRNGYNVSVYEKNSAPGGRCGQLIRDGHRFDLGATMLIMPSIYREIFQSLGIPLFENNDITPLENLYKIYFDNNEVIPFSPDESKMKLQLEKIEPGVLKNHRNMFPSDMRSSKSGLMTLSDAISITSSSLPISGISECFLN